MLEGSASCERNFDVCSEGVDFKDIVGGKSVDEFFFYCVGGQPLMQVFDEGNGTHGHKA